VADEVVAGVRLAEVRAALAELKPGHYPPRELYGRYIEACRSAGYAGSYPRPFGVALGALGVPRAQYVPELGESARWVDPAELTG
jgi:hypothetical protein